jgi:ZIP family zinc transporter
MSYQQTTRQGIDPFRAPRVVVGFLIATLGLYVVVSQAAPVLWAAILHIAATPAKLQAVEFSAIAGAATGLGGMALLVMKKIDDKGLGLFIAIAGGMMAAAAVVSLFMPAVQTEGALIVALVATAAGYGVMTVLDQTLPHEHPVAGAEMAGKARIRMAFLMTVAIALHNVPEGFAVGASAGNVNGSSGTAFSIGLQNIPEGLIVATALWSIGVRKALAVLAAMATGLVEPIGAGIGVITADSWLMGTPASMAFAAGAMAFVVCNEMIPESVKMTGKMKTIYATGVSTVLTAIALGWMGA